MCQYRQAKGRSLGCLNVTSYGNLEFCLGMFMVCVHVYCFTTYHAGNSSFCHCTYLCIKILIIWLLLRKLHVWYVKGVFRCQIYTNTMKYLPPTPNQGLREAQNRWTQEIAPVGRRYECIFPMLEYANHHTWCEVMRLFVEVYHHGVAAPPPHDMDCVGVNIGKENLYGPLAWIDITLASSGLKLNCGPTILMDYWRYTEIS